MLHIIVVFLTYCQTNTNELVYLSFAYNDTKTTIFFTKETKTKLSKNENKH